MYLQDKVTLTNGTAVYNVIFASTLQNPPSILKVRIQRPGVGIVIGIGVTLSNISTTGFTATVGTVQSNDILYYSAANSITGCTYTDAVAYQEVVNLVQAGQDTTDATITTIESELALKADRFGNAMDIPCNGQSMDVTTITGDIVNITTGTGNALNLSFEQIGSPITTVKDFTITLIPSVAVTLSSPYHSFIVEGLTTIFSNSYTIPVQSSVPSTVNIYPIKGSNYIQVSVLTPTIN